MHKVRHNDAVGVLKTENIFWLAESRSVSSILVVRLELKFI